MNSSFLKLAVKIGAAILFSFALSQTIKLEQKVQDGIDAHFASDEAEELTAN